MNSFTYTLDLPNPDINSIDEELNRIDKQLDSLYSKFCNQNFMKKAPKEIIDKESKKYIDFSNKQIQLMKVRSSAIKYKGLKGYKCIAHIFTNKAVYIIPIKNE